MIINTFSKKQLEIFKFIYSPLGAIIADGAVRSGKTVTMTISFILWAMEFYNETNFAICGKTVNNAERNILKPFQQIEGLPYNLSYKISSRCLTIKCGGKKNYFYFFGGKDESSYTLIQGITLAGVLFDEVALMPRSFVEQAIARTLSFSNSKIWFNCNPGSPSHWFYQDWVISDKEVKRLHFTMKDNPIMGGEEIARAESLFAGVFYDRYIRGLWVIADGLIYPMYKNAIVPTEERKYTRFVLAVDYGIHNATAIALMGYFNGVWYCVKEYYHSGRNSNQPKTDDEYYTELINFVGDLSIQKIIIDPSAASFIQLIKKKGQFNVVMAKNAVVSGISQTASAMKLGTLKINDCCIDFIKELEAYSWDEKSNEDKPIKINDHGMDCIRYHVMTEMYKKNGFVLL